MRRMLLALLLVAGASPAQAQLDPLLFLKRTQPNVLLLVDTSERMQFDVYGDYIDGNFYSRVGSAYESTLGVNVSIADVRYRRRYVQLRYHNASEFRADRIAVTGDLEAGYATFDERTRMSIARRSLAAAVTANQRVTRFGLIAMRQSTPHLGAQGNAGPVDISDDAQDKPTDTGEDHRWLVTRSVLTAANSTVGPTAPLVKADATGANASILTTLGLGVGLGGALTPASRDSEHVVDAPVDNLLDDAKTEAIRLAAADTLCRNTVAVLVVGGGEGTTTAEDAVAKAGQFLAIGADHRVPIYVIAIAPPASDVAVLQGIAAASGGQYVEITAAMVTATPPGQPVPEFVRAVNLAVQHAFAAQADVDTDPTMSLPRGPFTEHSTTSPIVGTVNLSGARDITGAALLNDMIVSPSTGATIPQRGNLMVTAGFALPGFEGRLRAFRVYWPQADATRPTGFAFVADGTRLWVASVPPAASRNIYTALPDGTLVAFDAAHAADLSPYLRATDASALIAFVRSQPLGAVVDSTPVIMDPPSLDPPPDSDYPAFVAAHKDRRSLVWVGTNDGMLHAIDARLGVEVWAFIPFNLLPKLEALRSGQAVGDFRYFVDGSPKVADVKVAGAWRTHLIIGEGAGGTVYQSLDVTLAGMSDTVSPTANDQASVLAFFASPAAVALNWAFPRYSSFDVTIAPYGDIAAAASALEKTVGETWSDPAVGQVQGSTGPYVVLTGSGFARRTLELQANRAGAAAGTTFYALDARTGEVLASRNVGSDGVAETADDCVVAGDCTRLKNALQADPVATGPADSRFITKAYAGDLDGRIWRFDIGLNAGAMTMSAPTKLYDSGGKPLASSMATVNVGGANQYLFQGTGSDLLPTAGASVTHQLAVVLDNGATGATTATVSLEKVDGAGVDEKVSGFPAVAGDIVFFTTTSFSPATPCTVPSANLYAFTFIGGPAYDTNGDGRLTTRGAGADTPKVKTVSGGRASAPFVADQRLVFAAGGKVELFGDPQDFNNGVGQAGVRILSWRDVR